MAEQLLRLQEAQQRLAIGRSKLFELIADGQIKVVRLGGRTTRIPESEIDRYITSLRGGDAA